MNTNQMLAVVLSCLLLFSPVISAEKNESYWSKYTKDISCSTVVRGIGGAAVGVGVVTVGGPAVVAALGFKAGGIAAGSTGAKLMSLAATTGHGGAVVGGLQSVGAAGVSGASYLFGAAAGALGGMITKTDCDLGTEKCEEQKKKRD